MGRGSSLWGPLERQGQPGGVTAQSQSLALLEMTVQDAPLRANYVLIPAYLPPDLTIRIVDLGDLPADWRRLSSVSALKEIGRTWLSERACCALVVPSAVVPGECNWLLNPSHPDFSRIKIGPMQDLEVDARLLRQFNRLA